MVHGTHIVMIELMRNVITMDVCLGKHLRTFGTMNFNGPISKIFEIT